MFNFRRWDWYFKSRIQRRLDKKKGNASSRPVFTAKNYYFEASYRNHATSFGGLAAIHALVDQLGLAHEINDRLHLLQIHLPYHESDHVLNIAYNALCNGKCFEDIELRRNDETFLDLLGAQRIPDPTTAGDFCRRFTASDVEDLQEAFDAVRLKVWAEQPKSFFDRATIDMDGTLVETTGRCKQGMDIAHDGTWGYHPLVVSMAETGEVLRVVNRSGNRPSHEGAAEQVNRALRLLLVDARFRRIVLRGDTDFSQTEHLDRWNRLKQVRFVFGYNAMRNVVRIAEKLPASAWKPLQRPPRYETKTKPRARPDNVKDEIVRRRKFDVLRLQSEEVAEFEYRPTACANWYRMIVVRKHISKEKGEKVLWPEVRYFFYITNEREWTPAEVVFEANDRCNQENLVAQLKGGMRALSAPADTLESNWAWMVMTSLAWNLKAWTALMLPESGRWKAEHRAEKKRLLGMEFKTFVNAFILIPCQIIKTGRRLVVRLLGWKPSLKIFFRLLGRLRE